MHYYYEFINGERNFISYQDETLKCFHFHMTYDVTVCVNVYGCFLCPSLYHFGVNIDIFIQPSVNFLLFDFNVGRFLKKVTSIVATNDRGPLIAKNKCDVNKKVLEE